MNVRAAVAGVLAAAALAIPANASAYRTWFEFTRQSNTWSPLTIATDYGGGFITTQTWRAGSGTSTDACWIAHGWLPTGWYDLWGHWNNYDGTDRKSTRLNSSHLGISYAVFCLKKKKKDYIRIKQYTREHARRSNTINQTHHAPALNTDLSANSD